MLEKVRMQRERCAAMQQKSDETYTTFLIRAKEERTHVLQNAKKNMEMPGSNSAGYCFECDPGKYNNEIGCPHSIPFSVQYPDGTTHRCNNACQSCTKGKWSDTSGANVESTCIHCSAGKFQDLTARISESVAQ